MGINVARMSSTVFVLTSVFDGLVAFFIAASLHQITPGFGLWATVKGLIVMILGGIGSIPGATIGGLLLGVIELQALARNTWSEEDLRSDPGHRRSSPRARRRRRQDLDHDGDQRHHRG